MRDGQTGTAVHAERHREGLSVRGHRARHQCGHALLLQTPRGASSSSQPHPERRAGRRGLARETASKTDETILSWPHERFFKFLVIDTVATALYQLGNSCSSPRTAAPHRSGDSRRLAVIGLAQNAREAVLSAELATLRSRKVELEGTVQSLDTALMESKLKAAQPAGDVLQMAKHVAMATKAAAAAAEAAASASAGCQRRGGSGMDGGATYGQYPMPPYPFPGPPPSTPNPSSQPTAPPPKR